MRAYRHLHRRTHTHINDLSTHTHTYTYTHTHTQYGACFSSGEYISTDVPQCYPPLERLVPGCWLEGERERREERRRRREERGERREEREREKADGNECGNVTILEYLYGIFSRVRSSTLSESWCRANPITFPYFVYWNWLDPATSEVPLSLSLSLSLSHSLSHTHTFISFFFSVTLTLPFSPSPPHCSPNVNPSQTAVLGANYPIHMMSYCGS